MVWGVSMRKRRVASTCCTIAAGTQPLGGTGCSNKLNGVAEFERGGKAGRIGVRAWMGSSRGAASATCSTTHLSANAGTKRTNGSST